MAATSAAGRGREQTLAERAALVAQGGELRGRLDPSATTSRSSVLARPMIEDTIAASSRSVYRSRTKLRSIFNWLTGKRFRWREAGIAGAEIVDHQPDAHLRQRADLRQGIVDAVHQARFGDLEFEHVGRQARFVEDVADAGDRSRCWNCRAEG